MKNNNNNMLSIKEKLYFSFGDLGYQFAFFWVTAFLMIFYTDVFMIPAAMVSVLMLVVRLYDAINDPILGSLMDRTKSKMGRYRPWIIAGGIGLIISVILMFWAHPSWSQSAKVAYMYITYIAVVTFSTMFYMAYMALNGCIAVNSLERAKASSLRMIMSYGGMLLIGYAAPNMIVQFGKGNVGNGYLISVIISAVIALPLIMISGFGSREVIFSQGVKSKIPIKQQWKALLHNKPMLLILIGMFIYGIQMNGRLMIATYYCTYVMSSLAALAIFNLLNSLFAILGSILAPTIFKITGHKGKASSTILFICALSMILQYFTGTNLILFYILVSITGFCYGSFSALIFSMIPDAVDYAQFKHNVRVDGFLNAIASFGFKVGGAIISSVMGIILSAYGYIANATQNEECLTAIRFLMTILPGICCLIAGAFLLFYKLDRASHQKIIDDLEKREAF